MHWRRSWTSCGRATQAPSSGIASPRKSAPESDPRSGAPDFLEQRRRRDLVPERDRVNAAAPGPYLGRTDNRLGLPVAALHQHVGPARADQLERRVLLEPGDDPYRLERGDESGAVGKTIDWPVGALA